MMGLYVGFPSKLVKKVTHIQIVYSKGGHAHTALEHETQGGRGARAYMPLEREGNFN